MRILITTPLYPPEVGGPAGYAKTLEEELPGRGIEVEVLPFRQVRHLPYIIRHIAYFFAVVKRGRKADALFALDPLGVGMPTVFAGLLLRKKSVVKIVGDRAWETGTQTFGVKEDLETFASAWGKNPVLWPVKIGQWLVARLAGKIIVPSEYLKRIVASWGVPARKITVIYNAFDAPYISESKEELRAMYDISGTVLLSAGRLVQWKGFTALVEIMPDILKEFPNAKLYIAGDGPEQDNLQQTTDNLQLKDHVVFLGALEAETLHRYMKAADVFALNTGYEGFSHTLLEAMSVGVPVVSTDAGGNPELVKHATEGLLVSFNNHAELLAAILEVLRGQVDTQTLVKNAQKKAGQFSRARMIEATIETLGFR